MATFSENERSYHTLVGAFRAPITRRPLGEREQNLVLLIAVSLLFATWAIGLRDAWAQGVFLALASAGMIYAALRPADEASPDPLARRSGLARLLRFPVFWSGLAVLVYIAIQGFNPAWSYREDVFSWYLVPRQHIEWLPSGNQTPFEAVPKGPLRHTNAFGHLLLLAGPWALTCAVWSGLTRRLSCQILLWVITANATVLTAVAVAQRATHAKKVLWFYEVPGSFWGSFSYRNWAASFLGLSAAVAIGLALNYGREHLFAARGRNPVALVALLAVTILCGAVLSGSRAGVLWAVGLTLLALPAGILLLRQRDPSAGKLMPVALLAILLAGFAALAIGSLQPKGWPKAIARLFNSEDGSAVGRLKLYDATWKLAENEPWTGIGAGGFRYHFPQMQQSEDMRKAGFGPGNYVQDAHNDWLQYRLELGWIGSAILLTIPLFWVWHHLRMKFWRSPFCLFAAAGLCLSALHAGGEFIWQNGACLTLLGLVAALSGLWRWIEHATAEEARRQA